jgi:carbamoyl-phosphate synthase large subunit
LLTAKQKGYADRQIAHLLRCLESEVYKKRNALGIKRVYKMVDTCAGEFEAKTPYFIAHLKKKTKPYQATKRKLLCWLWSKPHRAGDRVRLQLCAWYFGR